MQFLMIIFIDRDSWFRPNCRIENLREINEMVLMRSEILRDFGSLHDVSV